MSKPLSIDKAVDGNLKPIKDSDGTMTSLEVSTDNVRIKNDLDIAGDISVVGDASINGNMSIAESSTLYLDGGSDTFIVESSADTVRHTVGGDVMMLLQESGGEGNIVLFGTTGVGFTQSTVSFDATDTFVYFNRFGNKGHLTMTADITDVNLFFPNVSCNCQLIVLQDGTGGWDVTNWKTYDQASGNAGNIIWSGGSAPGLTETADKLDILSFYWDNTNHKAYGVASTNF